MWMVSSSHYKLEEFFISYIITFFLTILLIESVVLEQDQLNSLDQSAYILSIAAQTGFAVLYTRLEEVSIVY